MASASSTCIWDPFMLRYQNPHQKGMPAIGLRTHRTPDPNTNLSVVDTALRVGYRSFATTTAFKNEEQLGDALQRCLPRHDLDRDDIYVTTKLANAENYNTRRVQAAFDLSVKCLGFEPDLYLINFPGSKIKPSDSRRKMFRHKAWKGMVEIYDSGAVSAIGVSDFTIKHLEDLATEFHCDVPAVNEVEYNPLCHDEALHEYCNKNSIILQGYGTFGGTDCYDSCSLLNNPIVKTIATKHCVQPAQVLLTWSLQKGVGVIPNSTNLRHIEENIDLSFRLTPEEVHRLDHLSCKQVRPKPCSCVLKSKKNNEFSLQC